MDRLIFSPVKSKKRNRRSKGWIGEKVEMTGCPGGDGCISECGEEKLVLGM